MYYNFGISCPDRTWVVVLGNTAGVTATAQSDIGVTIDRVLIKSRSFSVG
jgi:hypothetical protein